MRSKHRHRESFLHLLDDDERRGLPTSALDMLDELDDREEFDIRIGAPLDIAQPSTMGIFVFGLDATPTGSDAANDVVADFTGATATIFDSPSIAVPVLHTPSQTLGSTFKVQAEGIWLALAKVQAQTAATVRAGLSWDAVAGDLSIDPAYSARMLDLGLSTSVAADAVPISVTNGPFVITRNMAQDSALGIARLHLSNGAGAGAAAAALNLPLASVKVLRMGNIPRAA